MRITELAWAAGLYEGEGSITIDKLGKDMFVRIGSSDKDVLEKLLLYTQVGSMRGPYGPYLGTSSHQKKPMWHWQTTRFYETQQFVAYIWSYLGQRRQQQIKDAFALYNSYAGKRNRKIYANSSI